MRTFLAACLLLVAVSRSAAAQLVVDKAQISDSLLVANNLYRILFEEIKQTADREAEARQLIRTTWVAQQRLPNQHTANTIRKKIALQLQRDSVLVTLLSDQAARATFGRRAAEMLPRAP
jgi:hypothetical protein